MRIPLPFSDFSLPDWKESVSISSVITPIPLIQSMGCFPVFSPPRKVRFCLCGAFNRLTIRAHKPEQWSNLAHGDLLVDVGPAGSQRSTKTSLLQHPGLLPSFSVERIKRIEEKSLRPEKGMTFWGF